MRVRFGARPLIGCVFILAGWLAGAARGQDSLAEVLEPRITRAQLDQLVLAVDLTRDQRTIVNLLYLDYEDALTQLIEETDALADEYGRQEVQAAFAGRLHLPQAELHQKRRDVLTVFAEALPEADYLLDSLLTGIEAVLMPEQLGAFRSNVRLLQRRLLFEPLKANEQSYDYAGDGIDVLELLETAMSPGGELAGLDPQDVAAIVDAYERQLDTLLNQTFAAYRDASLQRRIAGIGRAADASAEADRELVANWRVLFDLNRRTVDSIAEVAEAELGAAAAQRWRWRFQQAVYPWLYRPRRPDRVIGWLDREGAVSAEVDGKIRDLYREYDAQRDELVAEAASLMLEARLDHGLIIHSMSDPAAIPGGAERTLYQDLLRNSGELSKLEADVNKRIDALLNESQQRSLNRYLRSAR